MVVAIISVVAAMAAPRFSSAERRHRADAAAQRVVVDLDYLSRMARAQAASYAVSFSVTSDSYASSARSLDAGPDEPYVVQLDRPPYRARLIRVELADDNLVFDGYGMPQGDGQIVVGVGDLRRTVRIHADTGKVTIE